MYLLDVTLPIPIAFAHLPHSSLVHLHLQRTIAACRQASASLHACVASSICLSIHGHACLSRHAHRAYETDAEYMDDADLLSFRLTCRHADAKTLRVVGRRFFSTLKTTLMAFDLEKLDGVSRSARLAKYVRTILIQDDQQKVIWSVLSSEAAIAKPIGADREEIESNVASLHITEPQDRPIKRQRYLDPEELARLRATHRIWPRETVGILGVDKTAVAKLKAILQERLLSLDTLTIDYCDTEDGKKDTEATIALAQEIISGGKLATTSFQVYLHLRGLPWIGATLTLYLDRARQGEGLKFGLLQKVGLQRSSGGPSSDHLLTQIFHCAPMLEDLRLEYSGQTDAELVDLLQQGKHLPRLKDLFFGHSGDPVGFVKGVLSNSQDSLTRIGLRRISASLPEDFLREILDEYPQWKTWQVGISNTPWSEEDADDDVYEVAM